jgi:hypothetical protein
MRLAGGMKNAFSEVSHRRRREQPQLSFVIAGGIFVQPMYHRAQAAVDRATLGRILSRREVDLRTVGVDWTLRRIDDRDRTCSKLRYVIDEHLGQRRDAIGSADLLQSDARVAQRTARGADRCKIEIVFADINSDDRGVARNLEVQDLG